VHTFSLAFPGLPEDEGTTARRTAEHFKTTHAEWAIDGITGKQLFANFLRVADQPSIDGLNTLAVSKFARDRGMKVVLSGLGGDEIFAGYPSFDEVPRLAGWNRALSLTGPLRRAAGWGIERTASDPRWRRVGDLLSQPPDLINAYTTFRGVFTRAEARRLVERYASVGDDTLCLPRAAEADDPTIRDRISRLELTRYMRNQPLRDSDTMSMAFGLELRVPFLDGPLIETVARIPARDRLRAGKQLLLSAVPEVPAWVAGMPKRGFMFPFERWMADEWRETFAGLDRDCPVPTQTWYRKWCVFVLDRWVERLGSVHE
jgi:asparagine synthase (glutamine-hydrolysing)